MATGSTTQSEASGSSEDNPDRLKQLYPAVDEEETPLPRTWSPKDKSTYIGLSQNNLRVHYKGVGKSDKDAASVRATHPIPAACGIYYFEIKIISKGRDGYMGIGLSAQGVHTNRLPGWDKHSYGYHGDDGNAFCWVGQAQPGQGQPYGPTFTTGDTVGCCVNLIDNTCFYTKNGVGLGIAFNNLPPNLYPTVGLQTPGEVIEANFGQSPFVYDIEDYMEEWRHKIKLTIERFPVSDRKGEFQAALNRMVSTYLVHHGYCSSAEAFSRCTDEPIRENIQSIQNRQRIQKLVLEGRMGEAIETTQTLYPELLDDKPDLLFTLKCRQFVEMVNGTDSEVRNNKNNNSSSHRTGNRGVAVLGGGGGSPTTSASSSSSSSSPSQHPNNHQQQQHTRSSPRGSGSMLQHSSNNNNSSGGGDSGNNSARSSPSHSPHKPSSTTSAHTTTISSSPSSTSTTQQQRRGGTPPSSAIGSPNRPPSSSSSSSGKQQQQQQHHHQNSGSSNSNNHHQNGGARSGRGGSGGGGGDEAALNSVNNGQACGDHIAVNGSGAANRIMEAAEEMDFSDEGDHSSTLSNGNSHVNGAATPAHDDDEEMDVDGPAQRRQMCGGNEAAIEKMLSFGKELKMMSQRLRKDFGKNEDNKKTLQDAFSLLAYSDPWNSPIGAQLLPVKREPVCAALNSAILESKGLPRQPPLEVAIAQARQCMRLMSESGIGSCAFASVSEYLH